MLLPKSQESAGKLTHRRPINRKHQRQIIQHELQRTPGDRHAIDEPPKLAEIKISVRRQILRRALAVHQKTGGDSEGELLEDQTCADDSAESRAGAEVYASDDEDDDGVEQERVWRDAEAGVHEPDLVGEDEGVVAREGEDQTRGGLLACVEGEDAGEEEQDDEDCGGGAGLRGLVPDLVDGDAGRTSEHGVEVADAVEHGDDEGKGGDEADEDGGHERHWDGGRGVKAVFGKMDGAVETGVHEVGIDETGQEDDSIGPAGLVHEVCPYVLARLFGICDCETGDHEDDEAQQ